MKVLMMDLLYALMLPSGNDAAQVLADNFGFILKFIRNQSHEKQSAKNLLVRSMIK